MDEPRRVRAKGGNHSHWPRLGIGRVVELFSVQNFAKCPLNIPYVRVTDDICQLNLHLLY